MDNQSVNSYDMAIASPDKISIREDEKENKTYTKLNIRKTIYGVIIVLGIAGFFTLMTQFGKETISDANNFTSVTLFTWISVSTSSLVFPFYAVIFAIAKRQSLPKIYKESISIYPEKNFMKFFWLQIFPVAILLNVTNTLAYYPLYFTSPTDVSAIFSSVLAVVYILSVIFLKEPIVLVRILAVCCSIGGVILFAYADGFGSFAAVGVILASMFSITTGFYRVFIKVAIGEASSIQGAMFFSILSFINVFIAWIPFIVFYLSGIETIMWSKIPWESLMLTTIFNFFHNSLVVIGIGVTYPIFISLGNLFGIPMNAVVDIIIRGESFSSLKIVSTLLLVVGFVILLIPTDKAQKISRIMFNLLTCKRRKPNRKNSKCVNS